MEEKPILAVIGGSGFYQKPGLREIYRRDLDTPFGKPSAPIVVGILEGKCVAFLARHGVNHQISPSGINYRANLYALKQMRVERILSISACGSLRDDFAPGHVVIPDQLFDFTRLRKRSSFEEGVVAHVSVADPFCPQLSHLAYEAAKEGGATVHWGGALITIEGPRFSTRTESNTFRAWGMSLIGMTASPEAFLAREAEMCYALLAHVTDYDVWHVSEAPVTAEKVVETLRSNTEVAHQVIRSLVRQMPPEWSCSCQSALRNALITPPDAIPLETRQRLSLLIEKYL